MPGGAISTRKPFPGPLLALVMTYLAWWTQFAWTLVAQTWAPVQASLAVAVVASYGLMGWLALADVEPPWRPRVGLCPVERGAVPGLVLLVPVVFVAMAIEAVAFAPFHRGGTIGTWEWHGPLLVTRTNLGFLGALFVLAVLVPALAEWFFRGVLHQGLVLRVGPVAGVTIGAALYAALVAGLRTTPSSWVAIFAGTFVAGVAFGIAREATGSLWAPIAVHVGASALYAILHLLGPTVPVGFVSAPARFVPAGLAAASAVSVAAGAVLLVRSARARAAVDAGRTDPV